MNGQNGGVPSGAPSLLLFMLILRLSIKAAFLDICEKRLPKNAFSFIAASFCCKSIAVWER